MTIEINWRDEGLLCSYEDCASYAIASLNFEKVSKLLETKSIKYLIHDLSKCNDIDLGVAALICFSATIRKNKNLSNPYRVAVITRNSSFSFLVKDLQQLVDQEIACYENLADGLLWLNA